MSVSWWNMAGSLLWTNFCTPSVKHGPAEKTAGEDEKALQ